MERHKRRRRGGSGVAFLLCAAALASLLPRPSGAAADPTTWRRNPAWHDGKPPARHQHDHDASASLPPLAAPPPTAGADLPPRQAPEQQPAPHFGFPLQPTLGDAAAPVAPPSGGEGYPFIGSNPTVPLPTGMTDTATVLPVPDGAGAAGGATGSKVVGLAPPVGVQVSMIGLVLLACSILFLATS
ncbi:hypothetical protein ACP4OV_019981 [Aristida adscensionis]